MALVSVTLNVTDDTTPTPAALEDTIARVFSEDGADFVTQGTTDEDGEVVFELEDATTYWVRFFKTGYQFDTKLTIEVDSSETSNEFDVEGTYLLDNPPSTSEYLCKASGYVGGADWAPKPGIRFIFSLTGRPRVVFGRVLTSGDVIVESDSDGWIEVELVRGGAYDCVVHGMDDEVARVQVPDQAAVSITELIWPYTAKLEYGDNPVAAEVGEEETVSATVTLSSGVTTPFTMDNGDTFSARMFITFTIEDESICSITWDDDDNMVITGLSAGTTTITVEARTDMEFYRLPSPTRSLEELTIVVTE